MAPVLAVLALLSAPPLGPGYASLADVASAALVVWCATRLLRERERPLTARAALVLGAPVAGLSVAAVTSLDAGAGLVGFGRYLEVFVLVPAALVLLLRDGRDFRVVAWAVVSLAVAQGAIGVRQYQTGTGASYVGQDIRAVGTFGPQDVMGMANLVSNGLVVAVALALAPRASRRQRCAALAAAAALVPPLVVSFSRGAWIASALACAVVLLLAGMRRGVAVLTALAAAAVVLIGGFGVGSQVVAERVGSIGRLAAEPDRSVTDRYTLWDAALGIWRERPVTGVGLKGFPAHRDSHASLALSSASDTAGAGMGFRRQELLSPHNMYLLVLSEQGLTGLVALAGSWAAVLALAVRRLVSARRRGLDAGCGPAAVGLLVWQAVDFCYADIGGPSTVMTAITLGLAAWWALADTRTAPGAVNGAPRRFAGLRAADPPAPAYACESGVAGR
ncbi:O-antigen ligase family protein [Streptomyces sp. NPDC001070]